MQYIEQPEGFTFDQDDKALVVNRVFIGIEDGADLPAGEDAVSLPEIGEPLFGGTNSESDVPASLTAIAGELGIKTDPEHPLLVCRKRTMTIPQKPPSPQQGEVLGCSPTP